MGLFRSACLAAVVLALIAAPAFAQQFAPETLLSQGVKTAQLTLAQNGYAKARSINIGGRQWDLWRAGASCVGFSSYNGIVDGARGFGESDCGGAPISKPGGPASPSPGNFDIAALKGLQVSAAQQQLSRAGYGKSRSVDQGGKQWDLWENRSRNSCVGFASYYGQVTEARAWEVRDCRGGPSGGSQAGQRTFPTATLNRLSVRSAQDRLRSSGYEKARSIDIDGRQWDLWHNRDYRNPCVGFASYNGVVNDYDEFSDSRCRSSGGSSGGNNSGGWNSGSRPEFNIRNLDNISVPTTQSRLRNDGYREARKLTIDGKRWDLWYNDRYRNACVGFTSLNGYTNAVRNFEGGLCREGVNYYQ